MDSKNIHRKILNVWNFLWAHLDAFQLRWYIIYKNWIENKEYIQIKDRREKNLQTFESWEDIE